MTDGASLHGMVVGCGEAHWLAALKDRCGVGSALLCVLRHGLRGGIYLATLAGWGEQVDGCGSNEGGPSQCGIEVGCN